MRRQISSPLSFYKIFGYPTGVGALIVRRRRVSRRLRVRGSPAARWTLRPCRTTCINCEASADGFEDGTPDFLSIAALPAGFALLADGRDAIASHAHVARLTHSLLDWTRRDSTHSDGTPARSHLRSAEHAQSRRDRRVQRAVAPSDALFPTRSSSGAHARRASPFAADASAILGAAEQAFGFDARQGAQLA